MEYRSGRIVLVALAVATAFWLGACRPGPSDPTAGQGASDSSAASASSATAVGAGGRDMSPHSSWAGFVSLAPGETEALIVYSGAMHGMIESCGCAGNPAGGMTKEKTVVDQIRRRGLPMLYVNPGDLFPFDKRPAKMKPIAEAAALMGWDALAIGDQEMSEGLGRFRELAAAFRLPFLSANLLGPDGKRVAPPYMIKDLAGIKVGIFAVLGDQSYLYFRNDNLKGLAIEPTLAAIADVLQELRGKVDYIILLSHQDKYLDREVARRFPEINLIVGGHDEEMLVTPILKAATLRVGVGPAGDYLGVVHLSVNPHCCVRVLSNEIMPVTAQVAQDPQVLKIYQQYVKDAKVDSEPSEDPLPEAYQSSATCQPCHQAIYADYLKTRHGQAWPTLVKAGRSDEEECWYCHTAGFGRKSGFRGPAQTPELSGVTCQACHLLTHDHADRKIKDDLDYARDQKNCEQCHTAVTAPDFNFWELVEKIDHHAVQEKSNEPPAGYKHWLVTPVYKNRWAPKSDEAAEKSDRGASKAP
jgi:hypothetical protein